MFTELSTAVGEAEASGVVLVVESELDKGGFVLQHFISRCEKRLIHKSDFPS
jgi:hypothetical protein